MTLDQAQAIFDAIRLGVTVSRANGRVYLAWVFHHTPRRYRWDDKEGSHFPTWSKKAPWGGTVTTCFDMIARAVQGKPVFPLGTWRYLISGPCGLCKNNPQPLLDALTAANWPEEVPCILCGKPLTSCGDWWAIGEGRKRKSGPSCSMRDCREGSK